MITHPNASYGIPRRGSFVPFDVVGAGHALGSEIVSSQSVELRNGLEQGLIHRTTGVRETRQCAPGETSMDLAVQAVVRGVADAGLDLCDLDPARTRIVFLVGGMTNHLSPQPAVELADRLGIACPCKTVDVACAAPVVGLEEVMTTLALGRADIVILVGVGDLDKFVAPGDAQAAGIFGAGAGCLLARRQHDASSGVASLKWSTEPDLGLGNIRVRSFVRNDGVKSEVLLAPFAMSGRRLAMRLLTLVPQLVEDVLEEAGWSLGDVDHWVFHQPAPRLLELMAEKLGLDPERVAIPSRTSGNLGPASALVAFSMLRPRLEPGARLCWVTFGFGLTAGAATMIL